MDTTPAPGFPNDPASFPARGKWLEQAEAGEETAVEFPVAVFLRVSSRIEMHGKGEG